SKLSISCPSTVPCQRRRVVLSSSLPSNTYLPASSRLRVEFEMVIATSSRPMIGLMSTGLCITTFSARIAATCSGVGGPASRSLRRGGMGWVLSVVAFRSAVPSGSTRRCRSPCASPLACESSWGSWGRLCHGRLPGLGNGDLDRYIRLGDISGQAHDLFLVVVRIDPERTRVVDLGEVVHDYVGAPEACPVALGSGCGLGDEKRRRRIPQYRAYFGEIVA